LTYFLYRIINATTEGFNSVIQALKYAARGFRSFGNYRTRILFFCGKLDLRPPLRCHRKPKETTFQPQSALDKRSVSRDLPPQGVNG